MATSTHQTSLNFAIAQTALLCIFAAAIFLDPGPRLMAAGGVNGVVGSLLCLGGLLLMGSAFASIRGVIQIAPEPRAGGQLVTRGIYQHLRHPIYTGILMLVVGLFLRKATLLVGLAGAVVNAFLMAKVRFEEKLLLERYPEYAEYKTRTWGLIPWPRRSSPRPSGT